ncbi:MAG: AbrB/MazE/SpoVT family DNA-binding domain-containing protein [Micrococcales bacterium]|nr:AbrB/MazE/SpoVT family DNA-binding domain-containing protein [Micrococcales bacterium]
MTLLGHKGRLVVPAEIRRRHNWDQGTALVFAETETGQVLLQSADGALAAFRASVVGTPSAADELVQERRYEAKGEVNDQATTA